MSNEYLDIAMNKVIEQEVNKVLEDIKAEIEQVLESLSDGGDDWFTAEKVNECIDIIDKHMRGTENESSD